MSKFLTMKEFTKEVMSTKETFERRKKMFIRNGGYVITGIPVGDITVLNNGKLCVKLIYVMQENNLVFRELDCVFPKDTDMTALKDGQVVMVTGEYEIKTNVYYGTSIETYCKYGKIQQYEGLQSLLEKDNKKRAKKRYSDFIVHYTGYSMKESFIDDEDTMVFISNLDFEAKLDFICKELYSNFDSNYIKTLIVDVLYFNTFRDTNPDKITGIFKNKLFISIYNDILDSIINQISNSGKVYILQHLIYMVQLYMRIEMANMIYDYDNPEVRNSEILHSYIEESNDLFKILDKQINPISLINSHLV